MQKGFISDKNRHLIEKINNYIAKNNFDNIIITKFSGDENSAFSNILNWNKFNMTTDCGLVVKTPNNATILNKNTYGLNPENIKYLKGLNISEIEVCGVDIDACVLAVAFDLFDNNIKPIILADLCETSSQEISKNLILKVMSRQFGEENIKSGDL